MLPVDPNIDWSGRFPGCANIWHKELLTTDHNPELLKQEWDILYTPMKIVLYNNACIIANAVQVVRDEWGRPIRFVSWWRSDRLNEVIGGHPKSLHKVALALDPGMDSEQEQKSFLKLPSIKAWSGGLGYGINGRIELHLDRGKRRQWNY